jgi:penicillin-binding protein 1B
MGIKTKLRVALQVMVKHRGQILGAIGISILLVMVIAIVEVMASYSRYAAIIDARLADRSLLYPAGIYAAPCRVSLGERITRDDLVERLLRAGYQESERSNQFAAGSFTLQPDSVEFRTNEFAVSPGLPALARVSFDRDRVSQIEDGHTDQQLNAVHLPPEMLTADINTKKQTRRATSFDDLPPLFVKALSAIEDRQFFAHRGVDVRGTLRALFTNLVSGRIRQGGSTITQQLIKSQFLTPERTYERKLAEAMMAIAIERRLTKEQIFALYCDRIYLGHSGATAIYGFKRAAVIIFGKELRDLSLSEAACLAGLGRAPNRHSMRSRLDVAIARRNVVLDAMADAGRISAAEAASAKGEQLVLLPPQRLDDTAAPHFVDYLRRELSRHLLEEEVWPRLRIETTLDPDLQQAANQAVTRHLNHLTRIVARRNHTARPEVALIALDPHSGEILAMVGGRDYAASQLNRATDAMRQPGSVFKPIVYAAALSHGISPATTFMNAPHEIEFGYKAVYRPQNFGHSYSNLQVTLREAIVRSLNVVAVDAAMQAGLENVAEMAARLGLPRPQIYPSMALGAFETTPLDIARAYTTFANDGVRVDPLAIRTIKANGEVLITGVASKASVLPSSLAYLVTDTLADVVNRGTAARIRSLGYRGPAAGKTGTSRDAWFVGYTPNLLVVVWVGNDDNSDLRLTGAEAAVPIWADFITRALQLRPDLAANRFVEPAGLETVEIDAETGALANEFCARRQRMLMTSFLVPGTCLQHQAPLMSTDYEELNPALTTPAVSDTVELPILSTAEVEVGRELAKPIKQVMPPGSLPKPIKHPPFP